MNGETATPKFTVVEKPSKVKVITKAVIKHTTWKQFCYAIFTVTAAAIAIYFYIEATMPWYKKIF